MAQQGKKHNLNQEKRENNFKTEVINVNNVTTDILLTTQKDRSKKKSKTKSMKQKKANFDVSSTKKQFGRVKKPKAKLQQLRVQDSELEMDYAPNNH